MLPLAESGPLQNPKTLGSELSMSEVAEGASFRVRPRAHVKALAIVALWAVVPTIAVAVWRDPPQNLAAGFRAFSIVLVGVAGIATILWVGRSLGRRRVVTVLPSGLRGPGPDGLPNYCAWAKVTSAELGATESEEAVVWVHARNLSGCVGVPVQCLDDPKFSALVQLHAGPTNPFVLFLRRRRLENPN